MGGGSFLCSTLIIVITSYILAVIMWGIILQSVAGKYVSLIYMLSVLKLAEPW